MESHGGSTFCAVATLAILDRLDEGWINREELILWLLDRHFMGFQGRVGKPEDTCYTFWIGAPLAILGGCHFVNQDRLFSFICANQDHQGGLGRDQESHCDPNHTYLSLAGLSLFMDIPGLKKVNPKFAMADSSSSFFHKFFQ